MLELPIRSGPFHRRLKCGMIAGRRQVLVVVAPGRSMPGAK